jgi:cysteine desulfurase/selenocysteine lyase
MIRTVTFQGSTWNDLPYKFEAGTPNIAGAVGLGAAIDYVRGVGFDALEPHETALVAHATAALGTVAGVRIIGTARRKASVVSFVMDGIHPHDIGTIVDREGVAIRTGHHCAQPVMDRFGIPATARASFAMYNTMDEVDALVAALGRARALLG